VSRTVRASIAAGFAYVNVGISIIAGLWLVPFTLHHVGARSYGLWLASGELLAYAGIAELGMLVTLPWLIAQADKAIVLACVSWSLRGPRPHRSARWSMPGSRCFSGRSFRASSSSPTRSEAAFRDRF